ncbi:MAG: phosphotransferase [Pseudonocardiaceae bacterium]
MAIGERSIMETFARKFTGIGADVYLNQLAAEWRDRRGERNELWAALRRVVNRLNRLRTAMVVTAAPVLVYGDLKPEHVVFERHTVASDRPMFIDPGMSCARPTVDSAKLVSRTILLLIGFQSLCAEAIGDGLAAFVDDRTRDLPTGARQEWLRELLVLWLMDTVNILTTYLSAPRGLPLPRHAEVALSQARIVSALMEKVSAELVAGLDPELVWSIGLADAVGRARLVTTA